VFYEKFILPENLYNTKTVSDVQIKPAKSKSTKPGDSYLKSEENSKDFYRNQEAF
jgi:hypothetical protein